MIIYRNVTNYLRSIKSLVILYFFLVCTLSSFTQQETFILTEIVTDNANVFTNLEKQVLEEKLTNFETTTSHQLVILTIDILENETIENYALDIFKKNKLGQKGIDNGILILFSKYDREVRIEVGYGLESIITDALASRIIREIMIPNFKENEYFTGINEGSSKIIALINEPELIDEFLVKTKKSTFKIPIIARILASIFLTVISLILYVVAYNGLYMQGKNFKEISFMKKYKANTGKFYVFLFLTLVLVAIFLKYSVILFCISIFLFFFSCSIYFGINKVLKKAFKSLIAKFIDVFTGDLGIFIFPFYLIFFILYILIGVVCIVFPMTFIINFGALFLDIDISQIVLFKLINLVYLLIGFLVISVLISMIIATVTINRKGLSYSFSFFKNTINFTSISNVGSYSSSRRSYSSSNYSSSSSSSSSSFSGGGGGSGGGGASGSW